MGIREVKMINRIKDEEYKESLSSGEAAMTSFGDSHKPIGNEETANDLIVIS